MIPRLATVAAAAALLAACSGAPGTTYDVSTDPRVMEAEPGSLVYSDTWKPGWLYDETDNRYYVIAPPRR